MREEEKPHDRDLHQKAARGGLCGERRILWFKSGVFITAVAVRLVSDTFIISLKVNPPQSTKTDHPTALCHRPSIKVITKATVLSLPL